MPPPMEPPVISHDRDGDPSEAVVLRAAEWLAHVESGDASEQDYRELDAWRCAAPAHALALDRLGGVRESLDGAPLVEREALRRLLSRPRRGAGPTILGVIALACTGWMVSRHPTVQLHFADQKTLVGETRDIDLIDGSHLALSTDSAVNIDMGGDRQTIRLLRGEVFAQVAKHDGVSFTVTSKDGAVVALGTAFSVRKEADFTTVAVAESRVRVCPALGGDKGCVTLTPGQRGRMSVRNVERLAYAPITSIGAWTDGWLSVEDRPLVEVLDELNLWREKPIRFDRRALSGLRVSGVFPLQDPDRALANLTKLMPVSQDRSGPEGPVVSRR